MADTTLPEQIKVATYKKHINKKGEEFFFADGADEFFNKQFTIVITHVPSGGKITFKAFITAFNDTYSQDWNSEQVFGRADPLYNFKQTTRRISFGLKMPAASEDEAYSNLAKAQKLAQFMYPNYTDVRGAKVLSQGPLLRLKIMNLLRNSADIRAPSDNSKGEVLYNGYNGQGEGILGFFNDVTFNFNLENDNGSFQQLDANDKLVPGSILPKLIEVNVGAFNPIHEHLLGWQEVKDKDGARVGFQFGEGKSFPYGANSLGKGGTAVGSTFSALEKARLEKKKAEAAIANAEARYGGMFGDARFKRDARKIADGKYGDPSDPTSKAAYVLSAMSGYAAEKQGVDASDGISGAEAASVSEIYDGFVEQL